MAFQRELPRRIDDSFPIPIERVYVEGFGEEAVEDPRLRRGQVVSPEEEILLTVVKYTDEAEGVDDELQIAVDPKLRLEFSPRGEMVLPSDPPQEFQMREEETAGEPLPEGDVPAKAKASDDSDKTVHITPPVLGDLSEFDIMEDLPELPSPVIPRQPSLPPLPPFPEREVELRLRQFRGIQEKSVSPPDEAQDVPEQAIPGDEEKVC